MDDITTDETREQILKGALRYTLSRLDSLHYLPPEALEWWIQDLKEAVDAALAATQDSP